MTSMWLRLFVSLFLATQLLQCETPILAPAQLSGRIWRIAGSPAQVAAGTIYIFVPDGTLLETSCVETYRIARWTTDGGTPNLLRVFEDGQLAFTAKVVEIAPGRLKLQRKLARGNQETREMVLNAVNNEFVCPDLPK